MATPSVLVRQAGPADSAAIAETHVAAWRAGYDGLLPAAYLASLSVAAYAERWQHNLSSTQPGDPTTFVGVVGDQVRGFATVGASRDTDAEISTGELWGLYVHPDVWRSGVGSALHGEALTALARRGFLSATLWVLGSNQRAQRFYEGKGWTSDRSEKIEWRGNLRLDEVRYRLTTVHP